MKVRLSVSKLNKFIGEIDLGKEIVGIENSETSFLIGRSQDCHVQLNDHAISREHAQIIYANGNWSIKKISSFGELKVDGEISESSVLKNGTVIKIGDFSIEFSLAPTSEDIEVSRNEAIEESEADETELIDAPLSIENEEQVVEEEDATAEDTPDVEAESNEEFFSLGEDSEEKNDLEEQEPTSFEESNDVDEFDFSNSEEDYSDENHFESEDYGDDYQDDYGVEEYEDDKTAVALNFSTINLEIVGEYAPYDHYKLTESEVIIGRDPEKANIVLNDPEVSGVHAKIVRSNISCRIKDLDSGNGTLLNGRRTNEGDLSNGDEIIIGSTVFTIKIGTDFLASQKSSLMPVEENQEIQIEEIVEVDDDDDDFDLDEPSSSSQSLFSKDALKNPEKRKKILIIAVVLVGIWVLLGEEEAPSTPATKKKVEKVQKKKVAVKKNLNLSNKEIEEIDFLYQLGGQLIEEGKYREALENFDQLFLISKGQDYKNAKQQREIAREGLQELKRLIEKEEKDKREALKRKKVEGLVEKARAAVEKKNTILAESLFIEIIKLDPENYDVTELKLEIEAYKKKKQADELERVQKEAERKRQLDALAPGKNYYLKKEWYNAILKLEEFLRLKGIDEDLVKEGSKMLNESKLNLEEITGPLIGKARSLSEGQDLKGAYEIYIEILKYDPSNTGALNEMDKIRTSLYNRSKRVYRDALVSESLSRYEEAREKFQEVQQISPSDGEYYKKATKKLKDYLDWE